MASCNDHVVIILQKRGSCKLQSRRWAMLKLCLQATVTDPFQAFLSQQYHCTGCLVAGPSSSQQQGQQQRVPQQQREPAAQVATTFVKG
jgi:hypothetical protein